MYQECIEQCPTMNGEDYSLQPGEKLETIETGCCPYLEVRKIFDFG